VRRPANAVASGIAILCVAVPVGSGIVSFAQYAQAIAGGRVRPEFGVSLAQQRQLLAEALNGPSVAPVYLASHDDLVPSLTYLGDGRVRAFDDRLGLLLPAGPRSSAIIASDPTTAAGRLLGRLGGNPIEAMRLPWGGFESIYRVPGGGVAPAPGFQALGAAFDDGITVDSYRIKDEPGQPIVVDVVFARGAANPGPTPMAFNHILDANGDTVTRYDGPAYASLEWQIGDACLSEFVLPPVAAPKPYRLEFGLYDYPSLHRHHLTGPSLNAQNDAIDLVVP
jgi:hypothetical protein